MSKDSDNPVKSLWAIATQEGALSNPWSWFAGFLLICSFIGLGQAWHGSQGRRCDWNWGREFPFGAIHQTGCLANVTFNFIFSPVNPTPPRALPPARRETPVEPE